MFFKLSNKTKFPVETKDKIYAPVDYRTRVLQMFLFYYFAHIISAQLLHKPDNS